MAHSSSMENYSEIVELLVKYDRTFHAWSLAYALMYHQSRDEVLSLILQQNIFFIGLKYVSSGLWRNR